MAFAVAASQEWSSGADEQLSVEDVLWSAHRVGGPADQEHTSVQYALTGLDQEHLATEPAWPFGNPPWPANRPEPATKPEALRLPAAWHRLGSFGFDPIVDRLSIGLPVVLTVKFVPRAWRDHTGLIDSGPGAVLAGGHAILAVGAVDHAGTDCLIVKNSWGTWWGDAGFGYMTRRYLETYGIVAHVIGTAT